MTFPVRAALAAVLYLLSTATPVLSMQDSIKQSTDYVANLEDDCVYDHGYRCIEVAGEDFLEPGADRALTPGPYLDAWAVSYEDFLDIPEMTADQKKLKHYKVGFTHNDTQYIVLYQGLLLPLLEDGEVTGTMRATYGITTKYWIDKETLGIDKRLFLR